MFTPEDECRSWAFAESVEREAKRWKKLPKYKKVVILQEKIEELEKELDEIQTKLVNLYYPATKRNRK